MIITTDNGVQFCFIDEELGKQIGFFLNNILWKKN